MKKARIIQFVVQPVVVIDDGENLTPVEVKPISIPAAAWKQFADTGMETLLEQLQAQIEQ